MKNKIASSCEYSSMLTSYIIDTEINSSSSLNVIISLGPIPCLLFLLECYISENYLFQKLQCHTEVDQEMVAIHDLQVPIYLLF